MGTNCLTARNKDGTIAETLGVREPFPIPDSFTGGSTALRQGHDTMAMTIAISLFFGLVAAFALASCFGSLRSGWRQYRAITADLAALDRRQQRAATPQVRLPVRQPKEAFSLALAD